MQASFGLDREKHNQLYYMEYENDKGSLHFHSPIEFYFVDEGEMEVTVNGAKRLLKAGEMSVALSFCPHSYRTPVFSRSATLIIPTWLCRDFLEEIRHKTAAFPFVLDAARAAEIRGYARALADETMNPIKRFGYAHLALGTVLEELTFSAAEHGDDPDLASRILLHINDTYRDGFSLAAMAAAFGYSESHLSHCFKENFSIGLNRYVNLLRLRYAMTLLTEKQCSITVCAMESGCGSMRSFYRVFSEEMGCTPKQWCDHRPAER